MVNGQRGREEKNKVQKSIQKRRTFKKFRWPWEKERKKETFPVLRIINKYK